MKALENTVKLFSEKIVIFEEKFQAKDIVTEPSMKQVYQCDQCKDHDTSIQAMMIVDERAEALYFPPQPEDITDFRCLSRSEIGHPLFLKPSI